jgi:hypothetical protein
MPFKLVGRLIAVDASVNGETGPFIIDTGSYAMVLNSRVYGKGQGGSKSTHSVNAEIHQVGGTWTDGLVLNQFQLSGRHADLIDLSPLERSKKSAIYGIIGYYNLKNYEVYIDFYLQQITLFETRSNGNRHDDYLLTDQIVDTLDFVRRRHGIILETVVGNEEFRFALDTGAEINQLDNRVGADMLKKFTPIDRVELVGMDGKGKEVIAGNLRDLYFNNIKSIEQMPTVLTRLKHSREAFGTRVDGVLGYWFIKDRRILLNYKKRQIYFTEWPD